MEGLYFHCSLSVCPAEFLWTKFQPNRRTDLDAVFAKWLLSTLAQTLLKLVTLGQRSRSLWQKMYLKMMKKNRQKFNYKYFWKETLLLDRTFHCRHFDTKYVHIVNKYSEIFAIITWNVVLLIKAILEGCELARNGCQCSALFSVISAC